MVGVCDTHDAAAAPGRASAVVIEFHGVGKRYTSLTGKQVRAVSDFTLTVTAGEVLGIAGPNGAGKSTLINLLLGYLRPSEGEVRVAGMRPRAFVERHGAGYLSELLAIPPAWTLDAALTRYGMLAGIPDARLEGRVDEVVEMLGLAEHRRKKVKALSKGNLQRLGLAQALLRDDVRVMVLDEPTHGLDPVWTQRFRDLVHGMRRPDRAILIASHNLDELERVADRVAIIDRGRLQRIVTVRGQLGHEGGAVQYRLTISSDLSQALALLPGAAVSGPAELDLTAETLEALNLLLASAIAAGVRFSAVAPARSVLERQFREAVGES